MVQQGFELGRFAERLAKQYPGARELAELLRLCLEILWSGDGARDFIKLKGSNVARRPTPGGRTNAGEAGASYFGVASVLQFTMVWRAAKFFEGGEGC